MEDLISFAFCRWDFFQASVDFLTHKVEPALQDLDSLVEHFNKKNWPRPWLRDIVQKSARSKKPILRDFDILIALFKDTKWPENELRDILHACVDFQLPILHSCLRFGLNEAASLYLLRNPHAIFDSIEVQMTALHISTLSRATECVEAIEIILRDVPELKRVDYVNQLDDTNQTAFDYAMNISPVAVIDALIRAGAAFDNRDRLGYTPLMNACHLGQDEVIECLVDHGADITAPNGFNQSVLEIIMTGDSRMKHSLLKRLAPRTNQAQLNRALWHAVNNENEKKFVGVLLECGADPEYVDLSGNAVLLHQESPQSFESTAGRPGIPAHEHLQEFRTTNVSEPQTVAQRGSTDGDLSIEGRNEERDDGILAMMNSLSINDGARKVDAWCYIGTGSFSIVRIGPLEMCKYLFEKGVYGNIASLQNVSDSRNHISHITYTDEMGLPHRRYGRDNIKGIAGVVIAERRSWKCFRKAPTTYVKIKWVGIEHRDSVLCPHNYS